MTFAAVFFRDWRFNVIRKRTGGISKKYKVGIRVNPLRFNDTRIPAQAETYKIRINVFGANSRTQNQAAAMLIRETAAPIVSVKKRPPKRPAKTAAAWA